MFILAGTSPSTLQQTIPPKSRFSRKLVVLATATAAIVIILVVLLIPQGAAIIPLEVNYTVGEKMLYTTQQQITVLGFTPKTSSGPTDMNLTSNSTVEVMSFDGQYYTLNYTYMFDSPLYTGSKFSVNSSFIQTISKEGYTITTGFQNGGDNSSGNPNPFIVGLLDREEVRVGDTWTVPLNTTTSTSSYYGEITLTFQGFEDLTVPAGTFHVFRVDSTDNMTLELQNNPTTITINQNGTMYLELSTLRQIKSSTQAIQTQQTGTTEIVSSYTARQTSTMELTNLIQP